MAGTWRGVLTQTRASGKQDRIQQSVILSEAQSGLSGTMQGDILNSSTVCAGRLVGEAGTERRKTFDYFEERAPANCAPQTKVSLALEGSETMSYSETFRTSSGKGVVEGDLQRVK